MHFQRKVKTNTSYTLGVVALTERQSLWGVHQLKDQIFTSIFLHNSVLLLFPDHKVMNLDSNSLDVLILSLLIDLKGDILLIDIKPIEFEYGQKICTLRAHM